MEPKPQNGEEITVPGAIILSLEPSPHAVSEDLNGTVRGWNKAAECILGYCAEQIIGQPVSVLAGPATHNELAAILSRIRRGEETESYQTVCRHQNGALVHVALAVSPVRNPAGD